jgi:hypothetical protein
MVGIGIESFLFNQPSATCKNERHILLLLRLLKKTSTTSYRYIIVGHHLPLDRFDLDKTIDINFDSSDNNDCLVSGNNYGDSNFQR